MDATVELPDLVLPEGQAELHDESLEFVAGQSREEDSPGLDHENEPAGRDEFEPAGQDHVRARRVADDLGEPRELVFSPDVE